MILKEKQTKIIITHTIIYRLLFWVLALTSKISAWQFIRVIVVQRTQIKQFFEIHPRILNALLVNLSSWMISVTIPLYLNSFIVRISVSSSLLDLCFVFISFFAPSVCFSHFQCLTVFTCGSKLFLCFDLRAQTNDRVHKNSVTLTSATTHCVKLMIFYAYSHTFCI